MKTIIALTILVAAIRSQAAIQGSSIPNAHVVTTHEQSAVIRGRAPKNGNEIKELLDLGITDFLIFKNDTKGEVAKEISQLQKLGVEADSITHISFPWKDIHNFKEACTMTIQAMQTIQAAVESGRNIYFHCTVGEDRTGYLAGLWGMWTSAYQTESEALSSEMCARGYEAGNPGKPYQGVVAKIRETLTPTYLKMAQILAEAKAAGQGLDASLCRQEPTVKVIPSLHFCPKNN